MKLIKDWAAETGKNRGRLCGQRLVIGDVGESGVPSPVVLGEGVVEDSGADLEQEVGSSACPAHLLLFDHAADHLADRGLDERGEDGLPCCAQRERCINA